MPRIFPPKKTEVTAEYWRKGQGSTRYESCWGAVRVPTQRLIHRSGEKQTQVPLDASLDASGWTPEALERLLDLSVRLPFEEAAIVARSFGLKISSSELERLSRAYGDASRTTVQDALHAAAEADTETRPTRPGRVMVLQSDGVYALGRPEDGACPGIEVKSCVLYPQNAPKERWMLADVTEARVFQDQVHGLLTLANVMPTDTLIGLSDGANWLDAMFNTLGATRITDVYHATEYLETVMITLGWSEERRAGHRRTWYRGQINARDWLKRYQPQPGITNTWDDEAITALRYLTNRVDSMDYATYTKNGWPIGSGQIEGMNKNVIGTRMKRSGMHWSRSGAARMASLRAQHCARHPITTFQHLRYQAYPHLSP